MGEATTGDGEATEEGREGDRHPPHVRSPPTFQPLLRLSILNRNPITVDPNLYRVIN